MLEFRLLHHYLTYTCITFDLNHGFSELWKHGVVDETLRHDFLMDGILALSSFHFAQKRSSTESSYFSYALEYQNRAVAGFHNALSQPTPDNANALFLFSIITMICALIPSNNASVDGAQAISERILTIFPFARGIGSVTETCLEWIQSGPFAVFFRLKKHPGLQSFADDDSIRQVFGHLRQLSSQSSLSHQNIGAVCLKHMDSLETAFNWHETGAIAWLAAISEDYVVLVRDGEPLALLVFMLWGVLLNQLRDYWWVGDTGEKLVEEIYYKLQQLHPTWGEAARSVRACFPRTPTTMLSPAQSSDGLAGRLEIGLGSTDLRSG